MSDTEPSDEAPENKPISFGLQGDDLRKLLACGLQSLTPAARFHRWEPPTPEKLGRLLPKYQIECLIGRGGMGAVYKGIQPELDRPVAIKILPTEIATDEGFVTRFKREARTLAKLQHSRIITIHDFGQTSEGHLYFVMEYIDGTNLREILRGPGLPVDQVLLAVSQICDALYAAHRQGIVHRDIKPENVLITSDGYVKLADFGLARPVNEESEVLTGAHIAVGTPAYMAPEQREGQSDCRSDIYALGVMLYEMLTGRRPQGAFEPLSAKIPIDARLDDVVLKALQERPERRYQEVSDLKNEIDGIRVTPLPASGDAAGEATLSPPNSGKMPPKKWLIPSVVAALILGLLGLVFPQIQRRSVRPPPSTSAIAPRDASIHGEPESGRESRPAAREPSASGTAASTSATSTPSVAQQSKGLNADSSTPGPQALTKAGPTPPVSEAAAAKVEDHSTAQTPVAVSQTVAKALENPATTPAPPTEFQKWLGKIDSAEQEAYRKEALQPFEAGLADLRAHYLSSIHAALTTASAAARLSEALAWQKELQAFEQKQNVDLDHSETPEAIKILRATFRQQLATLDRERMARAQPRQAQYDSLLAQFQNLLTQHQRLEDALVLRNKREEIARAWLAPSPLLSVAPISPPPNTKTSAPSPAKVEPNPQRTLQAIEQTGKPGDLFEPNPSKPLQATGALRLNNQRVLHVVDQTGKPIDATAVPEDLRRNIQGLAFGDGRNPLSAGLVLARVKLPKEEKDISFGSKLVGNTVDGGMRYLAGVGGIPDVICIAVTKAYLPCSLDLKKLNYKEISVPLPQIDPAGKIVWLGELAPEPYRAGQPVGHTVLGKVITVNRQPLNIGEATIRVNGTTATVRSPITQGGFAFTDVAPGQYLVEFNIDGYAVEMWELTVNGDTSDLARDFTAYPRRTFELEVHGARGSSKLKLIAGVSYHDQTFPLSGGGQIRVDQLGNNIQVFCPGFLVSVRNKTQGMVTSTWTGDLEKGDVIQLLGPQNSRAIYTIHCVQASSVEPPNTPAPQSTTSPPPTGAVLTP
jgi:serine/threonine protein kinase